MPIEQQSKDRILTQFGRDCNQVQLTCRPNFAIMLLQIICNNRDWVLR